MADLFSGASAQSTPSVFNFGTNAVRVVVRDGEPWFVAKDVMAALVYSGHSAPAKVCEHIPAEWKGVNPIHTPGGEQKMLCLSEPGLYFFLGRSDKAAALPFQKWVYGEVLPSIRKTGRYEKPGSEMTVNEMVEKMTRQVSEPNGHPALLFMPLVEAVQRKLAPSAQPTLRGRRWLIETDAHGVETVQPISQDDFITNWPRLVKDIARGECLRSSAELVNMANACTARLQQRMNQEASRANAVLFRQTAPGALVRA